MLRLSFIVCAFSLLSGCDLLFSGEPNPEDVFDAPIDGLTQAQMLTFLAGDEAFGTAFDAASGLGPVFNAASCTQCHPGEGRGHPSLNLIRFGRGDAGDSELFNYLTELGGPQLQDNAIPGYTPEELPPDVSLSVRGGPIVVGLGLLELVPTKTILALADPGDGDGDGLSGRANFVTPPDFITLPEDCECTDCVLTSYGCKMLGRFGRKATAVSLLHQAAAAYHDDMGITSDFFVEDVFNPVVGGPSGDLVADPEVATDTLHNVTFYLQTLRPPLPRNQEDPAVLQGRIIFDDIGCADCHLPALPTGDSPIEALRFKTANAYTDLLLHDMGPALADNYPEQGASGREWRTTPLWGLGLVDDHLGGNGYYLHDGRALNITNAVELHDGEARASADAFRALTQEARIALLTFLRSL
jgi:CxxC motif-containing protein (DUF1111 family)